MTDPVLAAIGAPVLALVVWYLRGLYERKKSVAGSLEAQAAQAAFKTGADLLAKAERMQADPAAQAAATIAQATVAAHIAAAKQTLALLSKAP